MASERNYQTNKELQVQSVVQVSADHLNEMIQEHFIKEAHHIYQETSDIHTLDLKGVLSLTCNCDEKQTVIIHVNECNKKKDMEACSKISECHVQANVSTSVMPTSSSAQANDRQLFDHVTSLGQLELMRKYAPCHPVPESDENHIKQNPATTMQISVETSFGKEVNASPNVHSDDITKVKDEDSTESQNGLPTASIIPLKKTVKGDNSNAAAQSNRTDNSMHYQVVRVVSNENDSNGIDSDDSSYGDASNFQKSKKIKNEHISDDDYQPDLTGEESDDSQTTTKRKQKRKSESDGGCKTPTKNRRSTRIRKESQRNRTVSNKGQRTVAKLALKIKMKQLNRTKAKLKRPVHQTKEESIEVKEKCRQLESSVDRTNLACLLCNKTFETKRAFRRHTNRHWSKFQCDQCGKNFSSIDSLSHHQRGLHSKVKPYSCEECGQFFNFHHSYKLHMRKHRGERPYQCDLCDKSYLTGTHLKAHKQAIHHCGEKRKFACSCCGKEFNYNNSLKTHMMIHMNERPHKCSMCNKGFVTRQALKAHEESFHVSEKNYQCDICLKYYKSEHLRNVHRRRHTDDVNRFMCDICGRQFMFKSNLDAHVFVHMDARPFSCKLCGKTFKCMSSLYTHQYTHKSDTPFQCRICSKTFKTKNCCKAHEKRHNPERTFVCHTCGSCFPDKGGLSKHVRTIHAPARQFVCKFCGKTGTRADNMRTHIKSHGKILTPEELQNCITEVSINEPVEECISTRMTINSALNFNAVMKPESSVMKYVAQNPMPLRDHSPTLSQQHFLPSVTENMNDPTPRHTSNRHSNMATMRQVVTDLPSQRHLQNPSANQTDLTSLHCLTHPSTLPSGQSQNSLQQSTSLSSQIHLTSTSVQYSGMIDHIPGSAHHVQLLSQESHSHLLEKDNQYL